MSGTMKGRVGMTLAVIAGLLFTEPGHIVIYLVWGAATTGFVQALAVVLATWIVIRRARRRPEIASTRGGRR